MSVTRVVRKLLQSLSAKSDSNSKAVEKLFFINFKAILNEKISARKRPHSPRLRSEVHVDSRDVKRLAITRAASCAKFPKPFSRGPKIGVGGGGGGERDCSNRRSSISPALLAGRVPRRRRLLTDGRRAAGQETDGLAHDVVSSYVYYDTVLYIVSR